MKSSITEQVAGNKLANLAITFASIFFAVLALMPQVTAAGSFPTSPIQLSWFYKPSTDGTTPSNLAKSFQNFILTRNDEAVRDQLRTAGADAPMLQYVRFDAIHDACNGVCPCTTQPYRNQVAWNAGDFCAIQSQHPDWILRDNNGKAISVMEGSQRYVWMDPASAGWRDYWLTRVKQSQETLGWDGVFLDNVQASIGWYQRNNIQLKNYSDDASFQNAVSGFLNKIYTEYFYPQNRPLQGNIIEMPWASETTTWLNYLQNLDGAMQEDFAMGWYSGVYLTTAQWLDQLVRMEQSQQLGKRVVLVSQGDQSDQQRQQFAFASYLLITQGNASFRYTNSVTAYDKVWLYANYSTALGAPKGARYLSNSVWRRDFENGYVLADPVNHTGQIIVNGTATSTPATTTVTPTPVSAPTATSVAPTPCHVSKLSMWYGSVANTKNYQMNTEVRVVTNTGAYPQNASVTLTIVLPNKAQSVSIATVDQYGYAEFSVQSALKGTYTSKVTNISGTNIKYDNVANVASSATKVIK